MGTCQKDADTTLKGAPDGQIWNNLSTEMIAMCYNQLYKIKIHESILMQTNKWIYK